MDILIKNGTVILEDSVIQGDVYIHEGIIEKIGSGLSFEADRVIDATGLVVAPGGIDVHTHFNIDVGVRSVDDFTTGTIAAAFGGTTTIVDHMGFGPAGCDLHHQYKVYQGYTKDKCVVDYGLHGVFQQITPEILEEAKDLFTEGLSSFKIYMTYDYKIKDAEAIRVLKTIKDLGGITAVHCENDAILNYYREKFTKESKTEPKYHPLSRPNVCEGEAVNRMIALAETAEAPLYVVHVSAKESVDLIQAAREKGLPIIGETCPQYLCLNDDQYDLPGTEGLKYIMSPPLRKDQDREALWQGLKKGILSTVATDHCSFDYHGDKQRGKDDFTKCPNGAPGVETRMALMYSEGVAKGRLTLNEFASVISTNPARIFGMYPQKGVLAQGSQGDVVLIDPNKKICLTRQMLHENVDYTPYEGMTLTGWPVMTLVRGQIVVENERLQVPAGFGQFVKRGPIHIE